MTDIFDQDNKSPKHSKISDEIFQSVRNIVDGLLDEDIDQRLSTANDIQKIFEDQTPEMILEELGAMFEWDLAVEYQFGWLWYCSREWLSISQEARSQVLTERMQHYKVRVESLVYCRDREYTEQLSQALSVTRAMFNDIFESHSDASDPVTQMDTLLFMSVSQVGVPDMRAFYDTCLPAVQSEPKVQELLALSYYRVWMYQEALDIFRRLQQLTGLLAHVEYQISCLFWLGKWDEAKQLYYFARSWLGKNGIQLPLSYFRGTILSDTDLEELYSIVYYTSSLDPRVTRITQSALQYIHEWLKEIESRFNAPAMNDQDIFDENYHGLWIRKLLLLEVLVWVLRYTWDLDGLYPEGVGLEYISTLDDLFQEHTETNSISILQKYFDAYDQEWMEEVRELQWNQSALTFSPDEAQILDDLADEPWDMTEQGVSQWEVEIDLSELIEHDSMGSVAVRVSNILDFLIDRIEAPTPENQELLSTLIELQWVLQEYDHEVPEWDSSDIEFVGNRVQARLQHTFGDMDRSIFSDVMKYILEKYGVAYVQSIFFSSANMSNLDKEDMSLLWKDPRVILFSITIMCLGGKPIVNDIVSELLLQPCISVLDPEEIVFLPRVLFSAWLYQDVCDCILEHHLLLDFPECLLLYFMALSGLSEIQRDDLLVACHEEMETDDIWEFLTGYRESFPESIEYVNFAEMIHATLISTETPTVELELESNDWVWCTDNNTYQISQLFFASLLLDDSTDEQKRKKVDTIWTLYPHLTIDKKSANEELMTLLFQIGDRDMLEKIIQKANYSGFVIGYWKYAPLLLGTDSEKREGIVRIVQDPLLYSIPLPIFQMIHNQLADMNRVQEMSESDIVYKFQASWVIAYWALRSFGALGEVVWHFRRLENDITHFFSHWVSAWIEKLFQGINYSENVWYDSLHEGPMASGQQACEYILRHISEFSSYIEEQKDTVPSSELSSESWLSFLQVLSNIWVLLWEMYSKEVSDYFRFKVSHFRETEPWVMIQEKRPTDSSWKPQAHRYLSDSTAHNSQYRYH